MRRGITLTLLVLAAGLVSVGLYVALVPRADVVVQEGPAHDGPAHWTYQGDAGPEHWGEIQEDYALCASGRRQSPVNISGMSSADLSDIAVSYRASAVNIVHDGHTVRVDYDAGSSITYDGVTYQLLQFHFHHPSEHHIAGVATPLELHLVHRDADQNLAVIAVMLTEAEADNPAFATVFDNLPASQNEVQTLAASVNAADLLPRTATYVTYSGSLTTPPCSEGVRWLVMQEPVAVGRAQAAAFAAIFEPNARPVQPLNARDLLVDADAG